jgi:ribosomal-protein-alanine N-acetyltransferase
MIRKATVLDATKIAELDKKMFKDSLDLKFISNDLANNPMANYFVYEVDDKIVGYIGSWVSDNTEILNFCVLEEYQKQGIGTLLFNEVSKICEGVLTLEVRVSNLNAINFYTKKGFKIALKRRNYYSNGEDAILMVKE